ncbi:glycine betaine ABC transporter substrate-binding protein [Lacrimispora sp.]|uniref:glycine betaine ABC transporter substrate-binding protein n=1 Tax=Lacrimispora sp. TaxID=2719234 RepID=UPI002F3FBCDD
MKHSIFKKVSLFLILTIVISMAAGCSSQKSGNVGSGDQKAIKIGSKNFTENLILGEIYALALEDKGFKVERVFDIASSVVHTSLVNGDIDLYPEYTGTGLLAVLKLPLETDPQKVYDIVKEEYAKKFNVVWLNYAQANDGQGLVITTEASEKYGIKTISDLQKNAAKLRFASQGEFDVREDGIPALEATYGKFDWASSKVYDNALKYEVLAAGEADVAPASTTEGNLIDPKFTLLEDDKAVWPPYNIAPVVRKEVLDANPDIAEILNAVNTKIDIKTITELNAEVDVNKREYEEVGKKFYDSIK